KLTKIISIDNVIGKEVYAYANPEQFQRFKDLNYAYEILPHPGSLIKPKMASTKERMREWDSYPTYEAYIDMMYEFEENFPELCVIENIGQSVEGRDLLFARISDNLEEAEDEPEFMFTATMHGNETTGYVLMLRLIDYLLENYGIDPRVTNLVDNIEIWINPLANPDGTYHGGNQTVYGATRFNANGVDLNRNFPDPEDGPHPDGNQWQPETVAMMDLAHDYNFVLSANFHGGAEVVNYPWDTWPYLHADDDWFQIISHTYADAAQANSPPGYMDGFNDGITNGYQWYTINGGRQDYMNYFHSCREVTIEISNTMLLPANELPAHWDYNQESFLLYMEECLYGFRGIVSNEDNNPLDATVYVIEHEIYNSEVFTDPEVGNYHRMIAPGTYDIDVSAWG
ncbi:MAG: succinylglutamate desuccinylase/aspartoacylase family protein, partial [Candidatus Cloacimonetes bacterium]|nr:succinylglutamate desuccinylase/aspartoacylase family protein [Candidatus Cloacimonadota bacterium]